MIVAIEHDARSQHGNVIEMHCPKAFERAIGQVIRRLTGEHPVPVPICDCVTAYFVKRLTLEEACAVLRMVTIYGEDPKQIDRALVECEVVLGRRDAQIDLQIAPDSYRTNCLICRSLEGDIT